jgi:hypothetical protein
MSSSAWLGLDTAPLPDRAPANAVPEAGVSWQVAGGRWRRGRGAGPVLKARSGTPSWDERFVTGGSYDGVRRDRITIGRLRCGRARSR